ncbi:polysaccharide biosynthesis/export family protein [Agrobacterium pusense]|uniref:Polysaccharide export protein n=1 Tax=Agrobacterium pusense TaxID=648995 RepID=A0AA44IXC4_9HYPH|nr:polysaccharide biosynthesis/export family protein [Agrobacterium pusense]NRF07606.1 polysaccharide export protein [Agrobacterium pusense]NRF18338.1 polysaccharide export protein [Agrobacterium pusense]
MKNYIALTVCVALGSCNSLPGNGPLSSDISEQSRQSTAQAKVASDVVFDIIDIDTNSSRLIASYDNRLLQRRFGMGGNVKRPVIGVGDHLKVIIFEAGENGLFSTAESKQTVIDVIVQPDGKAPIPYIGLVDFSGRTLETVRQNILTALTSKAVEPDVIINTVTTASRNVTVSGAVKSAAVVPLNLVPETIMESIAKAGGPTAQPYESYVTLTRSGKTGTVLLKTIIENPRENIFVQPGDQIFLTREPRTFTVLGAVKSNNRVEFGSNDLNLLEGMAMVGGGEANTSDMRGYFVFRYEEPDIVVALLGKTRFDNLQRKGMAPDKFGRYPIVYRFDMTKAGSLLVGQTFPIKNRDVIYASRHPSVDFTKFLNIIAGPIGIVASGLSIYNDATD